MLPTVPDLLHETVLSLIEAARFFPAVNGKPTLVKTVRNWVDLGIKIGTVRVKLESARVGGRRVTSREAIDRFLAATSGVAPEQPAPRTPTARRRASERAAEYLRREFASAKRL